MAETYQYNFLITLYFQYALFINQILIISIKAFYLVEYVLTFKYPSSLYIPNLNIINNNPPIRLDLEGSNSSAMLS